MSKLDWKTISNSIGYRSLKKAMKKDIHKDVQQGLKCNAKPFRSQTEYLKLFKKVIGRAISIAYTRSIVEEVSLTEAVILNLKDWEADRDYWWINYYSNFHFPKPHSGSLKPCGINGIINYAKKQGYPVNSWVSNYRIEERKKSGRKPRWTMEKKRRAIKHKEYCAQYA